ncbi:MAG TPA: class I SAM-dependent methyltransferase [Dehalococcoidia bacterium]|nr:class I SAM-dependent methyltransferase [Dehalococcoidia bacterium]
MNKQHLDFCSSDEWAESLRRYIIPGALEGVALGDDVLEVGPGPGRTTDLLRTMAPQLTAVEIDPDLADALAQRMAGTNVTVVRADATDLPFEDGRFSAAVSFIMLHHVPTPGQQDELFREVARVLRPGGVLAGCDSLDTPDFRAMHEDDVCVPVPPDTLARRLSAAGFSDVQVDPNPYVVQFRATK